MRAPQRLLFPSFVIAAGLAAGTAGAEPRAGGAAPNADKSNSQFALRREEAGGADAATARARARTGDCAGALPSFDAAVRNTVEPTLRRDRGLCHEKLGNAYPAIDDYRAYLAARADAPDADQIRDRLSRLEEQVGAGGPSAVAVKERDDPNGFKAGSQFSLGNVNSSAAAAAVAGKSEKKKSSSNASTDEVLGPKAGEQEHDYDYYASQERLADAADTSPLRFGKGLSIGAVLSIPRFYVGDNGIGGTSASGAGYSVAAAIRYAFGPSATFLTEIGYAGYGNAKDAPTPSGPLLFVGLEYRIPLDKFATNQLLLGVGPGFERYTLSGESFGMNAWLARGRFGFRHVFGPSVGVELLVDGGPAYLVPTGSGSGADGKVAGVVSGSYAVIVGF
ncbi:MAG: hypothetical protein JWP97_5861 [Labilithrix sp.]|nr:hypothetical protein [Labilithrix sp.]